jgi:hypothetical protein
MSTAAMGGSAPRPRFIPAEISNWVLSYWLAVGFGLLLLLVLWPEVGEVAGFMAGGFGRLVFGLISAVAIAAAAVVTAGVLSANEARFRQGKLILLIGIIVLLLVAVGLIVLQMQAPQTVEAGLQSPSFWGASPTLAALLLVTMVLLPLFFCVLVLSMGGQPAIKNFFNPPAAEEFIEPDMADEGEEGPPTRLADSPEIAEDEVLGSQEIVVVDDEAEASASAGEAEAALASSVPEPPADIDEPLRVDSDFEIAIEAAEAQLAKADKTQTTSVKPVQPDEIDAPLPADEFQLDDESEKKK